MKAIWNGAILAESDNTVVVEGNHYFPADSIKKEYFQDSSTHSTCSWKGVANYYSIQVDGQVNKDAAWYYPSTKEKAKNIGKHEIANRAAGQTPIEAKNNARKAVYKLAKPKRAKELAFDTRPSAQNTRGRNKRPGEKLNINRDI